MDIRPESGFWAPASLTTYASDVHYSAPKVGKPTREHQLMSSDIRVKFGDRRRHESNSAVVIICNALASADDRTK